MSGNVFVSPYNPVQQSGVRAKNPPDLVVASRAPTTKDYGWLNGTLWLYTGNSFYGLASQVGGSSPSATWQQFAVSSGGIVSVANGGTGRSTLTAHGVLLGEGTSAINQSTAGTAGQVFTSGGASADGAYAAIGTNSGLTAHGVLLGENNSAFAATAAGATGQVLTGATGADPVWATLASVNIVDVTGTSQAMAVNTSYIADNAAQVAFTLPATAVQGSVIAIIGNGAGGWTIGQNANQAIKMNGSTTTTGINGSVSSTNRYNCISMMATVGGASTIWVIREASGTLTFV